MNKSETELLIAARKVCEAFANLPVETNTQQFALLDLRMALNNLEHDIRKDKV